MVGIAERDRYAGFTAAEVAGDITARIARKRERRRRIKTYIAGGAVVLSALGFGAKPAAELLGFRCKPAGTHWVQPGETLGGIVRDQFPTYNGLQRFSAESCTADANGIEDQRRLLSNRWIPIQGLK